jgi:protein-disulfide isomerase
MTTGAHGKRPTRNQQREAARAKAKELREATAKQDKRRRWLTQGLIVAGVLVVAAIIAIPITQAANSAKGFVRPANMATNGAILAGANMTPLTSPAGDDGSAPQPTTDAPVKGAVNIVLYEDYLCPACKAFDDTNAATLETLVKSGAATLNVQPIGMLWQKSAGTEYSRRAANAAACVATYSPNSFWAVNQLFYANQPAEGTAGPTDAQIRDLVNTVSPQNQVDVDSCITDKKFVPWVKAATDAALNGPMTAAAKAAGQSGAGTPTVLVNGQMYTGSITDAKAFSAFVLKAAGSSSTTATATPAAG